MTIPFTKHPGVQADIRRVLKEMTIQAENGELQGIFAVTVDKNDDVTSHMIGEKQFTLFGAAFYGLARRAKE